MYTITENAPYPPPHLLLLCQLQEELVLSQAPGQGQQAQDQAATL
jgi:hypothetical protein